MQTGKGMELARMQLVEEVRSLPISDGLTPRYLIFKALVESSGEMYYSQIAREIEKLNQFVSKQRIKIELSILSKNQTLVRRHRSPISGEYLYSVTLAGLEELRKKLKPIEADPSPNSVQNYSVLLHELLEPKQTEELLNVLKIKERVLFNYLSDLYLRGVIEKRKVPEKCRVRQKTKTGRLITRETTIYKTEYVVKSHLVKKLQIEEGPQDPLFPPCKWRKWNGEKFIPTNECPEEHAKRNGKCFVKCPDARN